MSEDQLPINGVILAEVVEPTSPFQPRPWGLWATFGLSLAVTGLMIALQVVVTVVFLMLRFALAPNAGPIAPDEIAANGLLLSLSEWFSAPLCLGGMILLVRLRKQWLVRDYLSLNWAPAKSFAAWSAALAVYLAVCETTVRLLGIDTGDFMTRAYRTAGFLPLFFAALLVAAPLFEELFFRGFMFRGIQQSRLGTTGAVLITALAWTLMHVQYDIVQLAVIFGGGILLGVARARSNSTCLTIAMHALWNAMAILETAYFT